MATLEDAQESHYYITTRKHRLWKEKESEHRPREPARDLTSSVPFLSLVSPLVWLGKAAVELIVRTPQLNS